MVIKTAMNIVVISALGGLRQIKFVHGHMVKIKNLKRLIIVLYVLSRMVCSVPRIFGPVKDYECLCGKYKRIKHRG